MSNWQKFHYRSLWQNPLWGEFQRAIGQKVWTLEVDGAYALVVRHTLPYGLCWLEVPRGPLFENDESLFAIMQKIGELGKKEQAVFVRLSSYQKLEIGNWKLEISHHDHHPETSLILDLSKTEEEILAQMKPKGRYNIKLAEKHGITVASSDNMDAFYAILAQTANRDGFAVHAKSYYEKMLRSLGEHGQLLLAEYEGRVIAGGIFVYLDAWGIYYYGASDHNYRNLMAPYLIQWSAIQEAKKRGCRFYDFLGIAPEDQKNHPWAGVTDFKKKFGGEIASYPKAQDVILRKWWYILYRLSKFLRR